MNCKYCQNESCVMSGIPSTQEHHCPAFFGTNADRIRSMSDEELAEWMASISSCMRCPVDLSTCQSMYEDKNGECDKILLDWLKSYCEVDDGQTS